MATATSGLVAPANRNEAMIHTFLSTVNAGLNALDKDTLSFTRFRSSPENVGDYVRRQAEKPGSIYSLKTYQDNAVKLINDPDASTSYRIVGGEIDLSGTYSAVAAIGYSIGGVTDYSCTGTLIGKNVVLTAGHCYNNCNEFIGGQIFIGLTTSGPGTVIKVKKAIQHPDFKRDPAPGEPRNDLTVLVLERDVTAAEATPIPLAPVNTLASHPSGTLAVGYGNTNASGSSGYGVRRFATIPIADWCDTQDDQATDLGAAAGFEFAAGAVNLDIDTCTGDSGGGNFVKNGGSWVLLGVTSRVTLLARRTCGDGGLYERADAQKYHDWIKGIDGVHLP